ncbi:MAG: hypothetical protein ACXWZ4_14000, partial [Gemmatirosa sp.]
MTLRGVASWIALVLGAVAVVASALSLVRGRKWWIRIWDFPRVQLFVAAAASLALWSVGSGLTFVPDLALQGALGAVLLLQGAAIWRYTRLAPREVQRSERDEPARRIALLESNVLQTNRDADRLIGVVHAA